MANKIICCSFEPGSMGGFITICNGVKHSLSTHYSKTIAVTKEAFIAAVKDRLLFNDILGIDIRDGWQNALADAIFPFQAMKEEFDADAAAKVSSELDVQIRGEDAVKADIEVLEKENAALEKATKKHVRKAKSVKSAEKLTQNPDEKTQNPEPKTENPVAETENSEEKTENPVEKTENPKEPENDNGSVENPDNSSADTGSEEDRGVSSDGSGSESAE